MDERNVGCAVLMSLECLLAADQLLVGQLFPFFFPKPHCCVQDFV